MRVNLSFDFGRSLGSMVVLSLFSLLLASCSSRLEEKKMLDATIGLSELQLVQLRGVPTHRYEVDQHIFLSYVQNNVDYTSYPTFGPWGPGPWGYYGGGPWGGGYSSSFSSTSCQTTFELVQDKVVTWMQRGDGC
ncbi:hypothetical protein [Entomobacter blattae]|uniref:Lipoprotein n=1 Tax=Entomobacter blattae TaxID=2762277 RepID=A0A7H1NTB6_9PROT|nr:hypothetical protein [Entomobacter blattae]QNT79026.1 hypothetical protein JGUZn3_18120 [Entomobacter blattae]